jgi:hypothetical protein
VSLTRVNETPHIGHYANGIHIHAQDPELLALFESIMESYGRIKITKDISRAHAGAVRSACPMGPVAGRSDA